jgi:DNA-directed RNA polymerase subunit beta
LRGADEIIRTFYTVEKISLRKDSKFWAVSESLVGLRAARDITVPKSDITVHAGKKITHAAVAALRKANVDAVEVADAELEGGYAASDIVNAATGEVILEANDEITPRVISMTQEHGIDHLEVFFPERDEVGPIISATLRKDPIHTHEESLIEIYRRLRPGDPPTLDSSRSLFENMFFNPQKYDFSRVGRLKLNTKLGLKTPLDEKILHPQDFYEVIKYLLKLRKNPANVDDIDHLGNRRVRSVGELLENQFRIGWSAWSARSRKDVGLPKWRRHAHDLINARNRSWPRSASSSDLAAVAVHGPDQPAVRITHKRRCRPSGPAASRAARGFEVRDVHPTHYGRICPIETPEGRTSA